MLGAESSFCLERVLYGVHVAPFCRGTLLSNEKKGFAVQQKRPYSHNDYFKMGAAVAVGELFDLGRLGDKDEAASEVRTYLGSFGLETLQDICDLGIKGPYLDDFIKVYAGN